MYPRNISKSFEVPFFIYNTPLLSQSRQSPDVLSIKVRQPNLLSIQSNGDQRGRHRDQRGRRRRGINRKDVSQVTDFGKFGLKDVFTL